MKSKSNAFLEYLMNADRFYDYIYGSIFSWCTGNKDLILDRLDGSGVVSYISDIEDIDLDFKNVWIDCKDNTKLEFDVAIETTIDVVGVSKKYYDREQYSARIWVSLSCTGSLNKRLNDFYIHGVDEFNKAKPVKPLSGDLVPYMKKVQYDDYANEILQNYYFKHHPEARTKPMAIDVDELATRMGLTVHNTSISEERSIFGQIFFADTEIDLFNADTSEYERKQISKNTVLVDDEATYLRSFGSRNMTIVLCYEKVGHIGTT
mgnify:CR=1 FL=1